MKWIRLPVAAAIVVFTGLRLGTAQVAVHHRLGAATYPVSFAGASWLAAPGGGGRAYFRYQLRVTDVPATAVVWVDADQQFNLFVNGASVSSNHASVNAGKPPRAVPQDITQKLIQGNNVIGLQVTNFDNGPALVRARIELIDAAGQEDFVTSPDSWQATSDLTQVHLLGNSLRKFATQGFAASGWPRAVAAEAPWSTVEATIPDAAFSSPLVSDVIGAPGGGPDAVVSTVVNLPASPTDGWLQVAATGTYTIVLNGQQVYYQSQAADLAFNQSSSVPLRIYDLGPFFHAGRNQLAVHITAIQFAGVAVQGSIQTARGSVPVSTGVDWAAQGPTGETGGHAAIIGAPSNVFPDSLARQIVSSGHRTVPALYRTTQPQECALFLLVLWLAFAVGTAVVAKDRLGSSLLADAAAHLPALALLGVISQLDRLNRAAPPFPYTPRVIALVWVVLLAGKALVAVLTVARGRAMARHRAASGLHTKGKHLVDDPSSSSSGSSGLSTALAFMSMLWFLPLATRLFNMATVSRGGGLATLEPPPVTDTLADPYVTDERPALEPPPRTRRTREQRASRRQTFIIVAIALAVGAAMAYDIGYEPLWQDEIVSILAARSMRSHLGVPRLPSSLLYLKGELYHGIIAFIGAFVHDNTSVLRMVSVLWFVGTVLVFGLVLLPALLPGRRALHIVTTALFATAPQNLVWARDIRMYQQEQFFTVAFLAAYYLALTRGKTRDIAIACGLMLGLYFSHEESFILLPGIALIFLYALGRRGLRDRRWWFFGGGAAIVIALQYGATLATHPPVLGYDLSNKPYVKWDVTQFSYYYTKVYFNTITHGGTLVILSTLAVIATVVGIHRRDLVRIYLGTIFFTAVITMSVVFSAKVTRYTFVTLPPLFILGVLGGTDVFEGVRRVLGGFRGNRAADAGGRLMITAATVPAVAFLALTLTGGYRDYGLAVTRLASATYTHRHVDYNASAAYVRKYERPGDLFITLAPPDIPAYYLGRHPDMIIQTGRNKLLYIIERNGRAVDTIYGVPVILSARDLASVMSKYHRIWLVTDQGSYFNSVPQEISLMVAKNFQEVYEATGSEVYLWSG
jgi:hypothetical protein